MKLSGSLWFRVYSPGYLEAPMDPTINHDSGSVLLGLGAIAGFGQKFL